MSFVRAYKRTLRDGSPRTYYARVENVWENGKVHQRVIEHLGTSPSTRTIPLDPALAARVALALLEGKPSPTEVWRRLNGLGLDLSGRPRQVSLTYNPPLRKYALHTE